MYKVDMSKDWGDLVQEYVDEIDQSKGDLIADYEPETNKVYLEGYVSHVQLLDLARILFEKEKEDE